MDTNSEKEFTKRGWQATLDPRTRALVHIGGLFFFGVAVTLLLEVGGLDLAAAGEWYVPNGPHEGWVFGRNQPWAWLYDYGEAPAWILAVGALILYAASKAGKVRQEYQRSCLVVVLTIALGPGVIVNGILKEYWGRPRPAQISLFGGQSDYRPVWQPGGPGQGRSFTCGHCSMAFAVSSAAAFYPLHPILSVGAFVAGTAYGIVMSVARMAQGGHFATDCLWSGIIVIALLAVLYDCVFRVPEHVRRTSAEPQPLQRGSPGAEVR